VNGYGLQESDILLCQEKVIMSSVKSHLLDPLNAVFKLALLNICEPGTRLSIYKHIVSIQRHDFKQAVYRKIYGDGVNDLYLLLRSVVKIVEWYITEYIDQPVSINGQYELSDEKKISQDEEENSVSKSDDDLKKIKKKDKTKKKELEKSDSESESDEIVDTTEVIKETLHNKIVIKKIKNNFYKNPEIKELMGYACKGLERLQKFYEKQYDDGMFMPGIQLIINTLQEGINGKLYIERLPVNYRKLDTVSLIHIHSIFSYWKDSNIKHILKLLKTSEDHINDKKKSYSSDKTEQPDPLSNDIILLDKGLRKILNGYVESILSILIPLDTEFQTLVERSYL
jgi:hypothetical protein